MVIVLVTKGKNESVDYAKVMLFEKKTEAIRFCADTNTGKKKYWANADILENGEEVELCQPDYEIE